MTNNRILHYIGCDGKQLVNTAVTHQQIIQLKELRCNLVTDEGEPVEWTDFDNPDEPQTVFQFILSDRRQRMNGQTAMAILPPIGVATVVDGACTRFEFYEGRRTLKKTHDLRSKELRSVELDDSMELVERIINGQA